MKTMTFALAALLAVSPVVAQSQDTTPGRDLAERVFSSIEDNPNGMLDMGEFVNFGRSIFTSMDADENLFIDFEEFQTWDFGFRYIAEETGEERAFETAQRILFSIWDRNGDGKINGTEYQKSMVNDFRRADVDDDAYLTKDEFLMGYLVNVAFRAALVGR